jgi:polar amino acid transport system substrate-binding protein
MASFPFSAIRRHALLAAGVLLLLGCAGTPSAPTPPLAPPGVRQALAPTGALRVGVYPGSPTSMVRGPAGAPDADARGLTVEVGRELARRLGVPMQLVVFERVPEIVDGMKGGRADMTITNASPARALEIDFTPPVVQLESGYLVPAGSALASSAQVDQPGVRVGVSQGSTSQGVMSRELKAARLVIAPSVVAATEMLRRGELEAFATNKGILFEMADKLPGSRVLPGRWGLEQLAVGVPKGREPGAAWLRRFVEEPATRQLVRQAAERAGLRGLADPGASP